MNTPMMTSSSRIPDPDNETARPMEQRERDVTLEHGGARRRAAPTLEELDAEGEMPDVLCDSYEGDVADLEPLDEDEA